jgi:hypothetical protein
MNRYGRLIEGSWPYLAAVLVTVGWYWPLGAPFPVPAGGLLGAALMATAVIVGFLATAKAVMLGVASSDAFKRLRDAGFIGSLFRYLFEAVWFGIGFLVYSVLGFFLDHASEPIARWYPPIWVLLGALVILLYARITQLFFMLLGKV